MATVMLMHWREATPTSTTRRGQRSAGIGMFPTAPGFTCPRSATTACM